LRPREGYDPQKESPKFGPVWKGGEWRLRDITNYMTTAAFTLLKHASQNREQWLTKFYGIGKDAVRPRRQGELFAYLIPPSDNDIYLLEILQQGGVYWDVSKRFVLNGRTYHEGTKIVRMDQPYGQFAKALLERQSYPNLRDAQGNPISPYDVTAHTLPLLMNVEAHPAQAPFRYARPRPVIGGHGPSGARAVVKLGLYRSHVPSMDEGWTRWVLERSIYLFAGVDDATIQSGKLRTEFNTIIIPDQSARTILNGYAKGAMPPDYTGGLGQEGVKALREFVEQGGTLIFLNRASEFAIEHFKLPVRNSVAHVPEKEFFVPGSILQIELDTTHPIAQDMPKETVAWVEDSPVFELKGGDEGKSARVIASYPSTRNPLLSGWLLGADRLRGKAALVEVSFGKGRIILFGFRPQYRAQSLATYPLLFNSLRSR
jgi:hypothetical protein